MSYPPVTNRRNAALALLLVAPAPTAGVLSALWAGQGPLGPSIWAVSKLWFLLAPALWLTLVERQCLRVSSPSRRDLAVGLLVGGGMFTVIVGAYVGLGEARIDAASLREVLRGAGVGHVAAYLGLATYWTLINSLVEEYAFRWFILRQAVALASEPRGVLLSAHASQRITRSR